MRKFVVLLLATSIQLPLNAQWFDWQSPLVPRTPDGKPNMSASVPQTLDKRVDLSGLWVPVNASGSLYDSSRLRGWAKDVKAEAERSFCKNDPRLQ